MGWLSEIAAEEFSGIFTVVRDASDRIKDKTSTGNAPGEVNSAVKNTGSSTASQNAIKSRSMEQMGAVLDFTAPQPFNDRLMVFAGISSDILKNSERSLFVFEINPQRLQRAKKKNQSLSFLGKSERDAMNGLVSPSEFHFLNLQYEMFSYSGVTPAFNPLRNGGRSNIEKAKLPGEWDVKYGDYSTSPGWLWFLSFQDFYDEYCDRFILMKYLKNFYQGVLDDFSFTRDANAPFNIRYSFNFRAVYSYDLSVGMGYTQSGFEPDAGPQGGTGDLVQRLVVRSNAPAINLRRREITSDSKLYTEASDKIPDMKFRNYLLDSNLSGGTVPNSLAEGSAGVKLK